MHLAYRWRSGIAVALFVAVAGWCVARTGVAAYVVPLSFLITGLVAWDLGWRAGLGWVLFFHAIVPGTLTLVGSGPFFVFPEARGVVASMMVVSLLAAGIIVFMADRLRTSSEQLLRSQSELVETNEALQGALAEVKELRGYLPICACCKDIRDMAGNWERLESYIARHSRATFTHGLCPKCLEQQLRPVKDVENK